MFILYFKSQILMGCICIPLTLLPVKIFNTDYNTDEITENPNEDYEDSSKKLMQQDILPDNVPNQDLPFRCEDDMPLWIERPYNFLNAPVIKFIHHSVNIKIKFLMRCLN